MRNTLETVKRDDKSFLGLRVDPKAFFDGDHADVDGDGAFSRVELVGALRDAFQPSDLRRCAPPRVRRAALSLAPARVPMPSAPPSRRRRVRRHYNEMAGYIL